jgi:RNA ligase (TIGR02306 family)
VNEEKYSEGDDLTDILGVTKFEEEVEHSNIKVRDSEGNEIRLKVSSFPSDYIEKSDEPRIQSNPKLISEFQGKPYIATLKYDGTSSTYLVDPNNRSEFFICSRNLRRDYCSDPSEWYSIAADKYKIKEKLIQLDCRFAIQGEIYGPKISHNYLGVKELSFAVFNAKDLVEDRYLDFDELENLCKQLDLPLVEVIDRGDSFNYTLKELKELCKGFYPNTKNHREGLVFRLAKNWHGQGRNSFKIINDEFLVKHDAKSK